MLGSGNCVVDFEHHRDVTKSLLRGLWMRFHLSKLYASLGVWGIFYLLLFTFSELSSRELPQIVELRFLPRSFRSRAFQRCRLAFSEV